MMIPLGNDVFYVLRAPVVIDPRDGAEIRDWDNVYRFPVIWALVTPFKMAEKIGFEENYEREHFKLPLKVFAPPGTDVLYTDRIEYWGEIYRVLGGVGRWRDFGGAEDHVEFVMRLEEG